MNNRETIFTWHITLLQSKKTKDKLGKPFALVITGSFKGQKTYGKRMRNYMVHKAKVHKVHKKHGSQDKNYKGRSVMTKHSTSPYGESPRVKSP